MPSSLGTKLLIFFVRAASSLWCSAPCVVVYGRFVFVSNPSRRRLGGAILLSLGIIAQYIGAATNMSLGKPLYVVVRDPDATFGHDPDADPRP
jgi:hypothetical protein